MTKAFSLFVIRLDGDYDPRKQSPRYYRVKQPPTATFASFRCAANWE
jgi:hypothetical protein